MRNILKKIISIVLIAAMLYTPAFADGVGNGDSDSGNLGTADKGYGWNSKDEGIRVTVVTPSGVQVGQTVDYSNGNYSNAIYFGKRSKISYRNNTTITMSSEKYHSNGDLNLPKIISENGISANIDVIKAFICQATVLKIIAENAGVEHDDLIEGKYKVIVEPIAYFYYDYVFFAMTATEAALFDQIEAGGLRSKMGHLTHKNLPLAMFLEWADLGFPSYKSYDGAFQTRANIITRLGILIWSNNIEGPDGPDDTVTIEEIIPSNPTPTSPSHYDYHTSITVCAASSIYNSLNKSIENGTATLMVTGSKGYNTSATTTYSCPKKSNGYIWWYFKTPDVEQELTMSISFSNSGVTPKYNPIGATVTKLLLETPPDPKPQDTNKTWNVSTSNYRLNSAVNAFNNTINGNNVSWGKWTSSKSQTITTSYATKDTQWYTDTSSYINTWTPWTQWYTVNDESKILSNSYAIQVETDIKKAGWNEDGQITSTELLLSNSSVRYSRVEEKDKFVFEGRHIYQTPMKQTATDDYRNCDMNESWSGWIPEKTWSSSKKTNSNSTKWRLDDTTYYNYGNYVIRINDPPYSHYDSDYYENYPGYPISETKKTTEYGLSHWTSWSKYEYTLAWNEQWLKTETRWVVGYGSSIYNLNYEYYYDENSAYAQKNNLGRYYKKVTINTETRSKVQTVETTYETITTDKYRMRTPQYWYSYNEFQGYNYYYDHYVMQYVYNKSTYYATDSYKYRYRSRKWAPSGYWTTSSEQTQIKTIKNVINWNWNGYNIGINLKANVLPDPIIPTVVSKNNKLYIPSGYGIFANVTAEVTGDKIYATGVQNVYNLFPEFYYDFNKKSGNSAPYGRLLVNNGTFWEYANNPYSRLNSKVHYTPIWYPDNTEYKVATFALDCWTPGGMLGAVDYVNDNNYKPVYVEGSVYDDWIVRNSK